MQLKDVLDQLEKLGFDSNLRLALNILCNGVITKIYSITWENAKTLFGKFVVNKSEPMARDMANTAFSFTISPECLSSY